MRKLHYLLLTCLLITLLSFILVSISSGNIFQSNNKQNANTKLNYLNINRNNPSISYNKNETTENKPVEVNENTSSNNITSTEETGVDLPSSEHKAMVNVIYSLPIKERAVFITIDDGWYPSWPLIETMQKYHLPITSFLIGQAAQKHEDYWQAFIAAGGDIENHTFSHPDLARLDPAEIIKEISLPIDYFKKIGAQPSLLRPPYGSHNDTVQQAAYTMNIKTIVLWNATMEKGILNTSSRQPLQPGDIILMHWLPDLNNQLTKLLSILKNQNLGVADLISAINDPDNVKVSWLK